MRIYYNGKQLRTNQGRFTSLKMFARKVWFWIKVSASTAAIGSILIFAGFVAGASNKADAIISTTTIDKTPDTIKVLEDKLAAIVHNGESQGKVMKEGEIFQVFDPSQSMRARCSVQGARPLDCDSYGPYQEKIGTIIAHSAEVYGHTVTQAEAMDIANSNDKAKEFFLKCAVNVKGCAFEWTAAAQHRETVQILIDTIRSLQK